MVAMFKYSPVATYSVTLPPQMMEFSGSVKREFLKKDSDDVCALLREFIALMISASII